MKWNNVDITPPDELVEVQDSVGNKAFAYPTYYPFKIIDSEVIPCAPYWDGGWMVECEGLDSNIKGIVKWRKIKN